MYIYRTEIDFIHQKFIRSGKVRATY